jgi:hypothetical protein
LTRLRNVRIDHVLYATADLDAAQARMEALGLRVLPGGVHDGLGTENRIVPLGDGYLELLAVHDRGLAAGSAFGRAVLERGDGLLGWAVAVEDVDAVAARLGVAVMPISRDGLSARLAGVEEAAREPFLPFFIARDDGVVAPGEGGAGGIGWIELSGNAGRLREWLGGAELPVRVVDGAPGVRAVGIGDRIIQG